MKEIHIGIVAQNTKQIINFYHKVFGFEVLFDDPSGYAELKVTDTVKIAIEPVRVVTDDLGGGNSFRQFLRIEVADMKMTMDECTKNGGHLLKSPVTRPYGKREAYITDPENNVIQLFQRI